MTATLNALPVISRNRNICSCITTALVPTIFIINSGHLPAQVFVSCPVLLWNGYFIPFPPLLYFILPTAFSFPLAEYSIPYPCFFIPTCTIFYYLPTAFLICHGWGIATISINKSWALPCRPLCIIPRGSKKGMSFTFLAGIAMPMKWLCFLALGVVCFMNKFALKVTFEVSTTTRNSDIISLATKLSKFSQILNLYPYNKKRKFIDLFIIPFPSSLSLLPLSTFLLSRDLGPRVKGMCLGNYP